MHLKAPFEIQHPPERPLVIFDGDCRFCRYWVERWRAQTGGAVDYAPLQSEVLRERFPELSQDCLNQSMHLIMPDGQVLFGAEAAMRALATRWIGRASVLAYERLPGFAPVSEAAYRLVARNRGFFSLCTRVLWGLSSGIPRFDVATRWFLRSLALIYIVAFWSLGVQLPGLVGTHGLEPSMS